QVCLRRLRLSDIRNRQAACHPPRRGQEAVIRRRVPSRPPAPRNARRPRVPAPPRRPSATTPPSRPRRRLPAANFASPRAAGVWYTARSPKGDATMGQFDQAARSAADLEAGYFLARIQALAKLSLRFRRWFPPQTIPLPGGPERTADLVAV